MTGWTLTLVIVGGLVLVALLILGLLAFEVVGHVRRAQRAVELAQANLTPRVTRVQPLLQVTPPTPPQVRLRRPRTLRERTRQARADGVPVLFAGEPAVAVGTGGDTRTSHRNHRRGGSEPAHPRRTVNAPTIEETSP